MIKLLNIISKCFAYALILGILCGVNIEYPEVFSTIGIATTTLVLFSVIEYIYKKDDNK